MCCLHPHNYCEKVNLNLVESSIIETFSNTGILKYYFILIGVYTNYKNNKIILCRLTSLRSYLKSGKTLKNMKKITLFIMDVGVLDQRFSLSEYWQGKSLVSRVTPPTTSFFFFLIVSSSYVVVCCLAIALNTVHVFIYLVLHSVVYTHSLAPSFSAPVFESRKYSYLQ